MAKRSKPAPLTFDVSTGLKNVLGGELITDDQVALFELIKNSFDARARKVRLHFEPGQIIVADDGIGMSKADIKNKWLFVAYSAKRDQEAKPSDYRDGVARRHFAGSKGVGRFSSDRLGRVVVLQTRERGTKASSVHKVVVDWSKFDVDQHQHFDDVEVEYSNEPAFDLPEGLQQPVHGTVIQIQQTHKEWKREDILHVKSALAKLINPFGAKTDNFKITVSAPQELEADKHTRKDAEARGEGVRLDAVVNGDVGNFIFSTLQEKTTFIDVALVEGGRLIESKIVDRGELVYRIREPNRYDLLSSSAFRCQLFFLNQSAKMTFARRVGVPSVRFGSVFLFRNDFRVFPIGNEGNDWFGIDRRKQQGFARFLGTRDIIGRIDVSGRDQDFKETSSRNDGLIETPAVNQLRECFWEHCLKRLERYVVPVSWADSEDKNVSDLSRLLSDPGRARVTAAVASLVDTKDVQLLEYSGKLVGMLNERSEKFEESLASLRVIAERTSDKSLVRKIDQAAHRYGQLKRSEEEARRQADEERSAKEAAEARAADAQRDAKSAEERLVEERRRNLFLTSISSLDKDTILNMHHQITIYAVDIQHQLENFVHEMGSRETASRTDVLNATERIAFLNRKVLAIARFATKANFRLESEAIEGSIAEYIVQYINGVARDFLVGPMLIEVQSDEKRLVQRFKPIDVAILVDNLIANAKKARASKIRFDITHPTKSSLHVRVSDNGRGLASSITPKERIFEKGFTTTDGSGLGLFHVMQVLGEMGGSIQVDETSKGGAAFLVRIAT